MSLKLSLFLFLQTYIYILFFILFYNTRLLGHKKIQMLLFSSDSTETQTLDFLQTDQQFG